MAYGGLVQGCRIEFHLHQKSNDVRLENTVDWALEHSLHLRPDVILMAMPEGTEPLGLPATSKSHGRRANLGFRVTGGVIEGGT